MASQKVLKFDFSGDEPPDFKGIDLTPIESLVVEIPLPSFGSSSSHIDLCGDLLDASWAINHLTSSDSHICEPACNFDPLMGGIGVQN